MSTNNCGIYALTDSEGKEYIGGTANLKRRKREHLGMLRSNRHNNTRLQSSFNSGTQFQFIILETCKVADLVEREQYHLDTRKPFYNIVSVACRNKGYEHNILTLIRMSLIKKELYNTGYKVWNKGISPTPEVREQISKTLKGRFTGEEHPFYGQIHTEEAKKLMVAASHRRKGTHHSGHKGRIFQLDKDTREVLAVFSSTGAATEVLSFSGTWKTAATKINESVRTKRTAYGYRWLYEKDLDQTKVDELLETLKRAISSQAQDTSCEGSETTWAVKTA